jgi:hypothetical protein
MEFASECGKAIVIVEKCRLRSAVPRMLAKPVEVW